MIDLINTKLREEKIFIISFFLATISQLISRTYSFNINYELIFTLLVLMLIIFQLEECNFLEFIAIKILKKSTNIKSLTYSLIFITGALAMFLTNDVALITIVPITIIISKKAKIDPFRIIILETLSANISSSLTPFGSPQNLFLYSYFNIKTFEFFSITFKFFIIGIVFVLFLSVFIKNKKINLSLKDVILIKKNYIYISIIFFILVILSVMRILNSRIILGTVLFYYLIFNIKLFKKVDYFLLGTFICFFVFINNISGLNYLSFLLNKILNSDNSILIVSVALSQIISNVPAAMLISGFTKNYIPILLGVSIGGMGSMIASLANLISYKIYIKNFNGKLYKKTFYFYNFIGVIFITFVIIYCMKIN